MYKLVLEAEDFIANAFIESNKESLTLKQIVMYEHIVCRLLNQNNFVLTLQTDYNDYVTFFATHHHSFHITKNENKEVLITKNPLITRNDLVEQYRSFLPYVALDFFKSKDALTVFQ